MRNKLSRLNESRLVYHLDLLKSPDLEADGLKRAMEKPYVIFKADGPSRKLERAGTRAPDFQKWISRNVDIVENIIITVGDVI